MRKLAATSAIALGLVTLPVTAAHAGATWIVGAKASATTVNAGQKVSFTGSVKPGGAAAGQKIVLQERFKPGAKWAVADHAKVKKSGSYKLTDAPTSNNVHSYRVVMAADKKHAKGVSKTLQVSVFKWVPLASLDSVNNHLMTFGTAVLNGKTFKESVFARFGGENASVEFNLGHKCVKLRSTFGISDDSTTGGSAEVGVLSDGTSVYDTSFEVGQSEAKTVSLKTKPLKIKLLANDTSTTPGTSGIGAFGAPQALCTK